MAVMHYLTFPPEIWILIFEVLGDPSRSYAARRDIHACVSLCKSLQYAAEAILYSHAIVSTGIPQLYSFLKSVHSTPRRAVAVRTLRFLPPGQTAGSDSPSHRSSHKRREEKAIALLPCVLAMMENLLELELPLGVAVHPDICTVQLRTRCLMAATGRGTHAEELAPTHQRRASWDERASLLYHAHYIAEVWGGYLAGQVCYSAQCNITHLTVTFTPSEADAAAHCLIAVHANLVALRLIISERPSWHPTHDRPFQGIFRWGDFPSLKYLEISDLHAVMDHPMVRQSFSIISHCPSVDADMHAP